MKPSRAASLAILLLVAWATLAATNRVTAHDDWVDVRLGREILATGHVPIRDAWSATAQERPYVVHEWLSCVLFAVLERAGGFASLSVLGGVCGLFISLLTLAVIPRARRHEPLPLLVWALCLAVVEVRLTARPHILGHVCEAAAVALLARFRAERRPTLLLALPVLQVVWINLHASALLGPVLVGLAALGEAGEAVLVRSGALASRLGDARRLSLVAAACGAACLVNPRGASLLPFAVSLSDAPFLRIATHEWKSPLAFLPWAPWAVPWLLLIVGSLAALGRRRRQAGGALAPQVIVGLKLGTDAVRFLPEMALLTLPALIDELPTLPPRWDARARVSLVGVAAALLGTVLVWGYPEVGRWRPVELGPGKNLALEEVDLLNRSGLSGVLYNEIADGGPVILAMGPRVRPVMDSRLDLYGPRLFLEWERAETNLEALMTYLQAHQVDLVMLSPVHHPDAFERLRASPDWKLEFSTPYRFLFSRVAR